MQLFALDVETDKSIFFYSAVAVAILGAATKLVIEIAKL